MLATTVVSRDVLYADAFAWDRELYAGTVATELYATVTMEV